MWRGGQADEAALLASAYQKSLAITNGHAWERVAFPAISTGVYGYPKAKAALVAYATVADFLKKNTLPATVWFVFFTRSDADIFMTAVDESASQ